MKVPLVDLGAQYQTIKQEVDEAVQKILDTQNFILGDSVLAFEREFCSALGGGEAAGCSSGTSALILALQALDIGPGHEVLVPANTFTATAEAVVHVGAKPIFVDMDPLTYNVSAETCLKALTPHVRALIAVHLYGRPAPMISLKSLCQEKKLLLIEDAAQAHGAQSDAGPVGLVGAASAFSFYPSKNLGAYGDAGAVTSNDKDLIDRVRVLQNHGLGERHQHRVVGWNFRLDALQAAVLRVKLKHLNQWTRLRRQAAEDYRKLLSGISGLGVASEDPNHVYHIFAVEVEKRDRILKFLTEKGIQAGTHYPVPLHLQAAYCNLGGKEGDHPHAERAALRQISLPIYPEMTKDQIVYVVENLRKAMEEYGIL